MLGHKEIDRGEGMVLVLKYVLSLVSGGFLLWFSMQAVIPVHLQGNRPSPPQGVMGMGPETGSENPRPHAFPNSPGHSRGSSQGLITRIDGMRERLKKDPRDLEALIFLGNANFDIQRFDQARDLYLKALEVDPINVYVRTDLASCYRNLGDFDRAIRELLKVLEIQPTHENGLYNLGVIFLNDKNNPEEAVRYWQAFVDQHPQHSMASGLIQRIEELKKDMMSGSPS